MKASHDDSLLKLERIPDVLKMEEVSSLHQNDPEDWHVQVNTKLQFRKTVESKNFSNLLYVLCRFSVQLIPVLLKGSQKIRRMPHHG